MIIGLTGKNASGKGEVAKYLEKKSFYYSSLSDVLRAELEKDGKHSTRFNLIEKGNQLRKDEGSDYLAKKICPMLDKNKNHIVDSIRNPSEIKYLKQFGDFTLLYVDACLETRFNRIKKRNRPGDTESFDAFMRCEEQEAKSNDPNNQQMDLCKEYADYIVNNDGTLEELYKKVDELLAKIMVGFKRPDWDEYFMDIAKVVASRSNCIKRKVASVIVKDRRIISTGYNGTPRGTRNCSDGGCPRCKGMTDSGKGLDECLCSHGEENAITQAAYHGISLKDSTLYSTFSPCLICTKMVINSGIIEIVYNEEYPLNEVSFNLLKEAGIIIRKLKLR